MMNNEVMFSSKTDNWSTPQQVFDELNEEFHFNLDPCADSQNHKCDKFYTKEDNGLLQDWGGRGFFVIHLMGKKCINGLKSVIRKDVKKIHLYVY